MNGWIGVDFDGTLAHNEPGAPYRQMGTPIQAMIERIRHWRDLGIEVRIVTARASTNRRNRIDVEEDIRAVQLWCVEHIGYALPVTAEKDFEMWALFDDRAVTIERNTGIIAADHRHILGTLEIPLPAGDQRDERSEDVA